MELKVKDSSTRSVQSGTPLLSVVPVQNMHVDANFKEVQLEKVKVGNLASHADIYGKICYFIKEL